MTVPKKVGASIVLMFGSLGLLIGLGLTSLVKHMSRKPVEVNVFHEGETEAEREARYAAWEKAADAARLRDWEAIQREVDRRCLDHVDGLRKELSPERGQQ